MDFILERVAQHQRTPKPVQPRDYTDCFLERMEEVGGEAALGAEVSPGPSRFWAPRAPVQA